MTKRKRKKAPTARRLAHMKRLTDVFEDFESGESGSKAMGFGLVVETNWMRAGGGSTLHVMVDDGVDDRRLAEWWPGTGTAVLKTGPPKWTRFDSAMELLNAAAGVRGSIRPLGRDAKRKPRKDKNEEAEKQPSNTKATKKARKTKRRKAARRLSKRRKVIGQMEADRAFHEQHCGP